MSSTVTYKGLLATVAACIAILAGLSTIHAKVVVPAIVSAAVARSREIVRMEIEDHSKVAHPGTVTRHEFNLLLREIKDIKEILGER